MDGSQEKDHAEELLNAPPRVLLVDDEPGLRTAVQAYFEDGRVIGMFGFETYVMEVGT